jgi:hypothetical protein
MSIAARRGPDSAKALLRRRDMLAARSPGLCMDDRCMRSKRLLLSASGYIRFAHVRGTERRPVACTSG